MSARSVLSIGNFFFAIQTTLFLYVLFPYLATFMSDTRTGLVVALGALCACLLFPLLPSIVAHTGAKKLSIIFALLIMCSLGLLALSPSVYAAILLLACIVALQPFLAYQLDLLLEATVAEEGTTGRVRTLFITVGSVAAVIAPLFLSLLLGEGEAYSRVFLLASILSLPFVAFFLAHRLPEDGVPELARMRDTVKCLLHDRDLAAVSIGHLLLYFFFVWAPFYIPLYLHNVLDIPWSTLGWMFTLMLVPYVLLEYPSGWLADKVWGDKELMWVGFFILGVSLGSFAFFTKATPLFVILIALIATRVGAAFVESMTEGHFFRRVSFKDINSVSTFRAAWPIGDFIAPLIGSAILFMTDSYTVFFLLTGGFLIVGGFASTYFIKDFR